MRNKENNFAYIDGANLHKGVKDLGWRLDFKKFRVWLREKYGVERAYLFLGFLSINSSHKKASSLLRQEVSGNIVFLKEFKERLEYQRRR